MDCKHPLPLSSTEEEEAEVKGRKAMGEEPQNRLFRPSTKCREVEVCKGASIKDVHKFSGPLPLNKLVG